MTIPAAALTALKRPGDADLARRSVRRKVSRNQARVDLYFGAAVLDRRQLRIPEERRDAFVREEAADKQIKRWQQLKAELAGRKSADTTGNRLHTFQSSMDLAPIRRLLTTTCSGVTDDFPVPVICQTAQ
jgi:hypothetical protein